MCDMIPLFVAVGLAGIVGGIAIAANWKAVKSWLSKLVVAIREAFATAHVGAHAGMVEGEEIGNNKDEIRHKLYYKENNNWMEQTTTRQVDASEVPPFIKAKIAQQEQAVDITEEMSQELQMEL